MISSAAHEEVIRAKPQSSHSNPTKQFLDSLSAIALIWRFTETLGWLPGSEKLLRFILERVDVA
jgi:hypothetical protein